MLTCEYCGRSFKRKGTKGPVPRYCSPSHRTQAAKVRAKGRLEDELALTKAENRKLRRQLKEAQRK